MEGFKLKIGMRSPWFIKVERTGGVQFWRCGPRRPAMVATIILRSNWRRNIWAGTSASLPYNLSELWNGKISYEGVCVCMDVAEDHDLVFLGVVLWGKLYNVSASFAYFRVDDWASWIGCVFIEFRDYIKDKLN